MCSPTASGSSTTARSSPRERPTRSRPRSAARRSRSSPQTRRTRRGWQTILSGFGEPVASVRGVAVRLAGEADLAGHRPRPRCARMSRSRQLQLHQPSLDDVFLAKTGRSLEGSRRRMSRRRRHGEAARRRPGLRARPPIGRANAAAACQRDHAARLPVDAARGQLGRPEGGDAPAGLSDPVDPRLHPRCPVHPGSPVRDHERRHRPRARHPDRIPEPHLAHADRGRSPCCSVSSAGR